MRIVCVDDEKLVREMICDILGELGHDAIAFGDADEALQWLDDSWHRIDLLITDIRMPKMTGFSFARKAQQKIPGLEVMFISAYGEGISAPAPILPKPCSIGILERALVHIHRRAV